MPGRSIRIARIAGIPVGISPWWLVIVGLITWSLGADYYPHEVHGISPAASYALGLGSALLLFASILAHEFGHALVARRRGMEIEEIDLWLLGGVAKMSGRPHAARDELSFALAGPAVTAAVALLFAAVGLALPRSAPDAVEALVTYQLEVNLLILGFNLVPAFPLDGGRVARALLWRRSGDIRRATNTAAALGRAFGYVLVAAGALMWLNAMPAGLWFALIGFFLIVAANAERAQEQVVALFTGVHAAELMTQPAVTIPAWVMIGEAGSYFRQYRFTAFPVTDQLDRVIGLLSIMAVERAASGGRGSATVGGRGSTTVGGRGSTTVGELADRDPSLRVDEDTDVAELLERPAFLRVGRAVVVDADGRAIGMISVTDIERALRADRIGRPMPPPGRLAPR